MPRGARHPRLRKHKPGRPVIRTNELKCLAYRLSKQSLVCALCISYVYFFSGCATRSDRAGRTQPPVRDSSGSSETESAVRESRVDSASKPAPKASAPSSARDKPAPSAPLAGFTAEGNASWYGVPFHGRRASNGEIYDMHKLTAAHRTLPFGTEVRVTNLSNGKSTVVRITDRGPFVEGRIIDLSMAAARELDSIGAGVVPVRLEILSAVDPAGFFTVQVGAFHDRGNAERLRGRLDASYSPIFIQPYDSPEGLFYRVRIGKVPSEDAARQFGDELRNREGFIPFVVRLDDTSSAGGIRER